MFNQEQKNEFIKSYTTSVNTAMACKSLFEHFEPFENVWGADLCTKTAQELQPAVDTIEGLRFKSQTKQLIILQKYVKWCVRNNIDGAIDDIKNIKDPGVDKIRQQTVANPQQLQRYLDIVYAPENQNTVDNTYRAFYWMAFGGMTEEDILNVNISDVDFMNMRINYNGTSYPIYGESIPCMMRCVTATEFVYIHPRYTTMRNRVPGKDLMRGIRGKNTINSIRVHLTRRADEMIKAGKIDKNISYYRVWLSGHFYRVYLAELNGIEPDFSYLASEMMEGKTYKLDKTNTTLSGKHKQTIKDYHCDYERWKFAHEL